MEEMIKPLIWTRTRENTGDSAASLGMIYYALDDGYWYTWINGDRTTNGHASNQEDAKAIMFNLHCERILAACY